MSQSDHLLHDREHAKTCHKRWLERRNRKQESERYREDWWTEQCGRCRDFVPLVGALGTDYGACTNPSSSFDGMVRFEHDGCVEFADAEDWVQPFRSRRNRRQPAVVVLRENEQDYYLLSRVLRKNSIGPGPRLSAGCQTCLTELIFVMKATENRPGLDRGTFWKLVAVGLDWNRHSSSCRQTRGHEKYVAGRCCSA